MPARHFEAERDSPIVRRAALAHNRALLEDLLPAMQLCARGAGYALAVHGSLARDIDLLAVPWVEQAVSPEELVRRLCGAVAGCMGRCVANGKPSQKPHGRVAWSLIHSGGCGYIDLSVVAPRPEAEE